MRKNIIISGTTLWNPGDDFIREGVINILKELPIGGLNLFFYDFCPRINTRTYSAADNRLDENSIDNIKDYIDYIVIPGLGAGEELIPIYSWILKNNLQRKCLLIGGYYNNEYAQHFIKKTPCKEILEEARIVISRSPDLINDNHIYLNCPAILSETKTKRVKRKHIKKILFSIQIPDDTINQHCKKEMHDLIMETYSELSSKFETTILCHFKTEYFHFLRNGFKNVIFNSFYNHYREIYSEYDMVISTRLHAGIYANSLGMPAVIINNHFRHKETLMGIPAIFLLQDKEGIRIIVNSLLKDDLYKIKDVCVEFKKELMGDYIKTLKEVL